MPSAVEQLIEDWRLRGEALAVPGLPGTRIWRQGHGPVVVCIHGVPASAFLYRKVLPALASRGMEGVALDLPGLGFADRPLDFDYTWTNLGKWLYRALEAAGIPKYHLVLHDIGGPVGLSMLAEDTNDRVQSLTLLNTLVKTHQFSKPLTMKIFDTFLGGFAASMMDSPICVVALRKDGMSMNVPYNDLRAYGTILNMGDTGSKAFAKMMKLFETGPEFEAKVWEALKKRKFPAQCVWARHDPALGRLYEAAREALNLKGVFFVADVHGYSPKHFLQEEAYEEIADRVKALVTSGVDQFPEA